MHMVDQRTRPSSGTLIVQMRERGTTDWCRIAPISYTRTGGTKRIGLHNMVYNFNKALCVAQSTINEWSKYRNWSENDWRVIDELTGEVFK